MILDSFKRRTLVSQVSYPTVFGRRGLLVIFAMCIKMMMLSGCVTAEKTIKDVFTGEKESVTYNNNFINESDKYLSVSLLEIKEVGEGWLEYKFEIENRSNRKINELQAVVLSKEGEILKPAQSGLELNELPKMTDSMLVGTAAVGGGMIAGVMLGIPVVGLAASAGYLLWQTTAADKSMDLAMYFQENNFRGKNELYVNEKRQGSLFFPAVYAKKIIVSYVVNNRQRKISLDKAAEDSNRYASTQTQGATNGTVLFVQNSLIEKGYTPGVADGFMGKKTRRAITRFQTDHNVEQTGEIDSLLVYLLRL